VYRNLHANIPKAIKPILNVMALRLPKDRKEYLEMRRPTSKRSHPDSSARGGIMAKIEGQKFLDQVEAGVIRTGWGRMTII
jgi:hypothetical protein